jgi:hypothetical protein
MPAGDVQHARVRFRLSVPGGGGFGEIINNAFV